MTQRLPRSTPRTEPRVRPMRSNSRAGASATGVDAPAHRPPEISTRSSPGLLGKPGWRRRAGRAGDWWSRRPGHTTEPAAAHHIWRVENNPRTTEPARHLPQTPEQMMCPATAPAAWADRAHHPQPGRPSSVRRLRPRTTRMLGAAVPGDSRSRIARRAGPGRGGWCVRLGPRSQDLTAIPPTMICSTRVRLSRTMVSGRQ